MKQKNLQKIYYLGVLAGLVILTGLMIVYSRQMKNRREMAQQEINLDQAGNEAIEKDTQNPTEATEETTRFREEITEETVESTTETVKKGAAKTSLTYDGKKKLSWPVKGNVILPFSMETTVYFETLDQYKCNPGMLIEAKKGQKIKTPAKCKVREVKQDEEYGTMVVFDLGNEYTFICGQLKAVTVKQGDVLESGEVFAKAAEPTDYYTLEGNHIYVEMLHKEIPINPINYFE